MKNKELPLKYKPVSQSKPDGLAQLPKPRNHYNPLRSIASRSNKSISILTKAQRIKWIDKKVKDQIGLPLAAHIDIVCLERKNSAYVFASSPAWLQRARFMQDEILGVLNTLSTRYIEKIFLKIKIVNTSNFKR